MAVSKFMPSTDVQGGTGYSGLTLPYSVQQQQQAQSPEDQVSMMMQDPQIREEAAAILAEQGIEPPASAAELAQPVQQPGQMPAAQMNPQMGQQMMQNISQTQQGTNKEAQGNGAAG